MKEKENTFICIDDNNNKVECTILFTFDIEKTGKNYIIYTDNTTDENGQIRTYASTYNPGSDESDLGPIETEEEWKIIEGILTSLTNSEENK